MHNLVIKSIQLLVGFVLYEDVESNQKEVQKPNRNNTYALYRGENAIDNYFHRSCDTNFQSTKKRPIIFSNIREFGSHNLMQEIGQFGLKIVLIPNFIGIYGFYIRKRIGFH